MSGEFSVEGLFPLNRPNRVTRSMLRLKGFAAESMGGTPGNSKLGMYIWQLVV